MLYIFNKFTKKSFRSNIRDTASQFRFYDIHPNIHQHFLDSITVNGSDPADAEVIEKARDPQFIEHALVESEAVFGDLSEDPSICRGG